MTSTGSPRHDVPSGDELDDILNGIDNEELFDMSNIQPQLPPQQARGTKADADIGIDEEIKVVKKRKPVPKLDEER
jgi:replication fork protection complex subunit Csm3/Swi3